MFRAASRLMAAVPSAPRGLYGGKQILHGHNISHSHRKTLRVWRPNIQVCFALQAWSAMLTPWVPALPADPQHVQHHSWAQLPPSHDDVRFAVCRQGRQL